MGKMVKLDLGNDHLDGLLLREVRLLDLLVHAATLSSCDVEEGVIMVILFLVVVAFVFVLPIIVKANAAHSQLKKSTSPR
jgi:hypothetical protein